jgi:hypothetical protein
VRVSTVQIFIGLAIIAVLVLLFFLRNGANPTSQLSISELELGPIRHAELSAALDERIRRFEPIFAEVYPRTHDEWLDGFKRDLNPEAEIVIWEGMASSFASFVQKYPLSPDARKEAFGLLLVRSGSDEQATLSGAALQHITKAQAIELVRSYSDIPKPIQVQSK